MFSGINQLFVRMTDHPDLGKLLLRLTLGGLLLFHVSSSWCTGWAGLPNCCTSTACQDFLPGVPGSGKLSPR